nr:MAG TPA: putative heme-dependent peroxidase [Caudoviricetes sp.]
MQWCIAGVLPPFTYVCFYPVTVQSRLCWLSEDDFSS